MVLHVVFVRPMIEGKITHQLLGRWTPQIKTALNIALIYELGIEIAFLYF